MFDLSQYDNFEVHPIVALDPEGNVIPQLQFHSRPITEVEQCEEDEVDIYSWGVYGHIPHNDAAYRPPFTEEDKGGIFCLCDCPDKETAYFIQQLLNERLHSDRKTRRKR